MAHEEKKVQISAPRTFCHAIPQDDGSIDPHQPFMGVISITLFRGKKLPNVDIKANIYIELRMVQPGINYPIRILRLRNGSLKTFTASGKTLLTIFNTRGTDLEYTDHFGTGFNEFFNQKVIEGLYNKIPAPTAENPKPYHRVMFTVDTEGKTHKLNYSRFEQELTENAAALTEAPDSEETSTTTGTSAGEELLEETSGAEAI